MQLQESHNEGSQDTAVCWSRQMLQQFFPGLYVAGGREKRKGPMISAGDAEFPRDYHTLAAGGGRGARRFADNSNGGFTSSSLDRRHNSVAAKSLEALNSIHKADIERQRDALMDLQKNKYTNSPGSLSQGSTPAGRQKHTEILNNEDL